MALNWDLSNIKEFEDLCYRTMESTYVDVDEETGEEITKNHVELVPLADALIWATICVGMGEVTEDTYVEFWRRVAALEAWNGAFLTTKDGPRPITLADVKAHIGLSTNVSMECVEYWWQRQVRHTKNWKKPNTHYANDDRKRIAEWDRDSGFLSRAAYAETMKRLDAYWEDDWDDEDYADLEEAV